MTHDQIIQQVATKVKATIDVFPVLPSFDFSYWKGYCNALEIVHGIGANDIYIPVKVIALEYCDYLRNGKPIVGIAKIK